jgi:hypothetical protein
MGIRLDVGTCHLKIEMGKFYLLIYVCRCWKTNKVRIAFWNTLSEDMDEESYVFL